MRKVVECAAWVVYVSSDRSSHSRNVVCEQGEWDAGHLKSAILAPQSKLKQEQALREVLKQIPKDKIVYTHCRAGGRALTCGDILKQQGYDVRPLKAGFEDLVGAGFEKAP